MIGKTPNTFIVGAGPVATAMAGALRKGGLPVLGLWARRPAAARNAGGVSGVAAFSAAPPDLMLESEVIVLAVRDDAISEVAKMLVGTGLVSKRHVLLHCSGALSAEAAFSEVRDAVGGCGILHPLRAISDGRRAMDEMAGTIFGVQGDEEGLRAGRALLAAMRGRELELNSEQMASYHAAAAMASNYLVAILDVAAKLLTESGIEAEAATAALTGLASGTLKNVMERGLPQALTGPIRRGDAETIRRHLGAIEQSVPDAMPIYRALGSWAVGMSRDCGDAQSDDLAEIHKLLS